MEEKDFTNDHFKGWRVNGKLQKYPPEGWLETLRASMEKNLGIRFIDKTETAE